MKHKVFDCYSRTILNLNAAGHASKVHSTSLGNDMTHACVFKDCSEN